LDPLKVGVTQYKNKIAYAAVLGIMAHQSEAQAETAPSDNRTIRRNLFGSKKQCQERLESLLHEKALQQEQLAKKMSKIYNFDFQNGVPLNGQFSWEKC
jgi:hypothetical protein